VVGHLSGLVQVYQPAARPDTTSRAEDLLLELQLSSPVLQLLCGTLVSGTGSSANPVPVTWVRAALSTGSSAAQCLGMGSSAAQYKGTGSSASLYLGTVNRAAQYLGTGSSAA
jgi:hypothetical protein